MTISERRLRRLFADQGFDVIRVRQTNTGFRPSRGAAAAFNVACSVTPSDVNFERQFIRGRFGKPSVRPRVDDMQITDDMIDPAAMAIRDPFESHSTRDRLPEGSRAEYRAEARADLMAALRNTVAEVQPAKRLNIRQL